MRNTTKLLVATAIAVVTTNAHAQDVLMRRPLPGHASVSPPSTATPPPAPAPDPTPTCSGSSLHPCATTPTPTPTPVTTPTPSQTVNSYAWTVGAWSGDAQCGEQGTMSRDVHCTQTTLDLTTYKQTTNTVDDSFCSDAGSKPTTTYSGTEANCDVSPHVTGYGDWTLDPNGYMVGGMETAQCSEHATRDIHYDCETDDGTVVSMDVCTQNIRDGGTPTTLPAQETGNTSGCTYSWTDRPQELGCHQEGETASGFSYYGTGPVHYQQPYYVCMRSDGSIADGTGEAGCPIGEKPLDSGPVAVGACEVEYGMVAQPACTVDGGQVVVRQDTPYNQGGLQACRDAGATCCTARYVRDSDLPEAPGTEQTIGTMGSAVQEGDPHSAVVNYTDEGHTWQVAGAGGNRYWTPKQ